jgi:NADH:ubiquinone oxidoreductase subunit E
MSLLNSVFLVTYKEEFTDMKKNLTTVAFRGTKAQEEQLLAVIAKWKDTPGALMPVLQEAQEIYGYLPM